jgi:biofilm PGA synthesis N-glycosyltransferase PgaC
VALTLAAIAGSAVLAVWLGYPVVLRLMPGRRSRRGRAAGPRPAVSVVLATRAAPPEVAARVANLRQADYPAAMMEIIVAVDFAAPAEPEAYAAVLAGTAAVIAGDPPGGKACALNAGVRRARGDVLVFTDSAQRFTPDTIPALVDAIDADVGVVTGRYEMAGTSAVVRWYWRYELFVRRQEARVHSVVGATGAVYGLRRSLWQPVPPGLILDDLLVPLQAVRAGSRVAMCAAAIARETRDFHPNDEVRRRIRTLTGVLQLCLWEPWILTPWHNPIALQFWMHKLGRLATPYLVGVGGAALLYVGGARWTIAILMLIAGVAAVMWCRPGSRASGLLLTLNLLLVAPLRALANAVRQRWNIW